MARVTVVGGSGFLGQRAVAALRKVSGLEVTVRSRRSTPPLDLTQPDSWAAALEGAEWVVDLSDSSTVPPDAFIAWCLERGLDVLEPSSDSVLVHRLLSAHRGRAAPGTLVLGAGIFTGLSNLLAAEVAQESGAPRAVTLGISSSPFSGAGAGTIALMVAALGAPSVRFEGGVRHEAFGAGAGPTLPFADGARYASARLAFPEAEMLAASTGAPTVDVFYAPRPGFLVPSFRALPLWLLRARLFGVLLGAYFTVLRRLLLSRVPAAARLYARAEGTTTVERSLLARDGMHVGGLAIAATLERLVARPPARAGAVLVDEVTTLREVLAGVGRLDPTAVLRVSSPG